MWRQDETGGAPGLTSPAVFGQFVVVGDLEGYVHWLRRDDGQFVARVRIDSDSIVAAPVATRTSRSTCTAAAVSWPPCVQ